MSNEPNTSPLEVVEQSALELMERASIDVQITTARKYPRQLHTVKQQMITFATLDQETAAGCFYTLPPRKGGDGKVIQGPSVRMAEIALSSFGHMRAGYRQIGDDGKVVTVQGVCHDLQNNVCVSVEVKRRVTTKDGRRYSDDMVVTTINAAGSIALRNATFKVIPLALVKPVYEQAKRLAIGDGKTLVQRRAASLEHFAKLGVSREKVFAALNVKGTEDIGLEQLEVLIGYANAIREGDSSVDEIFNPAPEKSEVAKAGPAAGITAAADAHAKKKEDVAPAPQPQPTPAPEPAPAPAKAEPPATDEIPGLGAVDSNEHQAAVENLKAQMAQHGVSEARMFGYASRAKLVPYNVEDLFELPTETLRKLVFAVPFAGDGAERGAAK